MSRYDRLAAARIEIASRSEQKISSYDLITLSCDFYVPIIANSNIMQMTSHCFVYFTARHAL